MTESREKKIFEILVRENSRMLTSYLRSLLADESVVDDLYQETMVVAWRRLEDCDLSRPFGPWLRGIATRLVLAHYRKKKQQPVALSDSMIGYLEGNFASVSAQEGDTWDEKIIGVTECMKALPKEYQDVVFMRYFRNETMNQVADSLGLSLEACKKRLQRGRIRIADCLRAKGLLFDGGALS